MFGGRWRLLAMAAETHRQMRHAQCLWLRHVGAQALEQLELDHVVAEEETGRVTLYALCTFVGGAHANAQLGGEQIGEDLQACGVAVPEDGEFGVVVLVGERIGFEVDLGWGEKLMRVH